MLKNIIDWIIEKDKKFDEKVWQFAAWADSLFRRGK